MGGAALGTLGVVVLLLIIIFHDLSPVLWHPKNHIWEVKFISRESEIFDFWILVSIDKFNHPP